MNDYMNQLRAWMDMYDSQGMGGPRSIRDHPNSMSSLGSINVMEPRNNAARMQWAQGMMDRSGMGMGEQAPDFFSNPQPAMQQPRMAPISDAVFQSLPKVNQAKSSHHGGRNMLAQLMGR